MGTILILLMTVVLFSTIIIWVTGLPSPQSTGRLDMQAKFTPIYNTGTWYGGIITITHRGGAPLYDYQVRLYLTINGNIEVLKLRGTNFDGISVHSYGIDGPLDNDWNIGETWSYTNNSIPQNPTISVIIADITRSAVLWQQDIIGFPGSQPPIFVEKWTDSNPPTPSRDPVQPGNTFSIYAKVTDPDGDLKPNSVYASFTFGGLGTLQMFPDTSADAQAGVGVFYRPITVPAPSSWDGGVVVMNATDQGGLQTQSRFVLSVVNLGTTNIFNNNTPQTGPLNLTKFNDLQRYDIFNKTQWDKFSWSATPTRTFKQGETVVVVVASKYLVNVDLSNQFIVYDTTSGTQQPLVYGGGSVGTNTHPSSNAAFTFNSVQAGYNIFIYQFSTKSSDYGFGGGQMAPGQYPVSFNLQTANVPPPKNRFSANDQITVCSSGGGGCPTYPQLLTYKDPAMTQPTGLFSFTQTVYVKIVMKSTDASFSIGNIQIQDYIGDVQILAAPGSSPVSPATINSTTSYRLSVDLSKPNLDNWLFGNNSYNFNILGVRDADENYNLLATQVKIIGPRWFLDATLGTMAQLHQNFGTTIYGNFYPFETAWTPVPLDTCQSAPGSKCPTSPITAVAYGDLDGRGYLDIVAGQDSGSGRGIVEWFRNTNGLGYTATGTTAWQKIVIDTLCPAGASPCITAIAVGHIERQPLLDIAVGTSTGDIWWYSNDGFWTAHFLGNMGARVNALKLADLNGDKIADLVVALATPTNSIRVFTNDGTGLFGPATTTPTLMAADSGGLGALGTDPVGLLPPFYLQTQTSNNRFETVQEAKVNYSVPTGEIRGSLESVMGSFLNVTTLDGQFETLSEGASGTTFSLGPPDGHRWNYTNIWAATTDTIEVHIHAAIVAPGAEPISVRWATSPTGPWNALGTIDSNRFGEYIFSFQPIVNINGGTIYISLLDSVPADGGLGGFQESIQVDHAYLLVTRSTGTGGATSHIWTTGVVTAGQDAYKFFVQGFHTSNNQGDDFNFRYATNIKGPYIDLLTLKAIGTSTTTSVGMDKSIGGKTLFILVEDTNRGAGDSTLNTVEIDWMYINGYKSTPAPFNLNPGVATNSLAIADMDGDGQADIVAGLAANQVNVYYNNGGVVPTWSAPDILVTPASVNSVDVGHFVGTAGNLYPDPRFGIAVALANNKINGYAFLGIRGLWSASTLFDLSTTAAIKIRVGDVDGDYWDDMVMITSDNHIFYLHNKRGAGFELLNIDNVGSAINDFDIGDVDRGVLATYATI